MRKVRLLTISPTCEIGGGDINLLRILRSLDKNEYSIIHLFPYAGPMTEEFKKAGIEVKIVDMPRMRIFKNPFRYLIFAFVFLPTVFTIKKIIQDNEIDIVCTSTMANLYGCLAAYLSKKPHILIAGEYLPIFRILSVYFYLLSDSIVCCSSLVKSMFKKNKKVLVIPPSIDPEEFSPEINGERIKKELGINGNLISMVTRIDKWKGVEVFIKAASYVKKEVRFIIFGQAIRGKESYIEKLERLILRLGLKETVSIKVGEYNYDETPQILAASDVVVHASVRHEPFGMVIIEAMAVAKPVIASKLGGPLEIINDGVDGMLIEPSNPRVLADKILMLLENPVFAKSMGKKAREKVEEKFNLRECAKKYDALFKTCFLKKAS